MPVMNQAPRSWSTELLKLALSVLVAAYALRLATDLILSVLPVLVPLAIVAGLTTAVWLRYQRSDRWRY